MESNKLKLGFIGGGINSAVGTTHFIASQMDGLFSIDAGCFSRDHDINKLTAKKWNIAENSVYTSWADMLNSEKSRLNAVVVLTPTPDHLGPVVQALNNGYNVICEKALVSSSTEAYEIEKVLKKTNGFLAVIYNYTGYPMVRELRKMIQDGRLGRIEQIHIEMPQEGFARLNREGHPLIPQQWRLKDESVPTISLDLGVHLYNMIDFLTGEKPVEVVATQTSFGRFNHIVDNVIAMARYSNDLICNFWFSKAAIGHRNGLKVRVYGKEGSAEWVQMDPEYISFSNIHGQQFRIDRGSSDSKVAHMERYNRFKSGHPDGFLEAFANFYADVYYSLIQKNISTNQNSDYVFSISHSIEGLKFVEAINLSAIKKCWIQMI
jgi:predicted dehydrogenase